MRSVFIYMIQYEKSDMVYIGSTVNHRRRLIEYKNMGTQMGDEKYLEDKIAMTILDEVSYESGFYFEHCYIELFKSLGFKLKNKAKIKTNKKRYTKPYLV